MAEFIYIPKFYLNEKSLRTQKELNSIDEFVLSIKNKFTNIIYNYLFLGTNLIVPVTMYSVFVIISQFYLGTYLVTF
jgi:hypothetical protein